MRNFADVKSDAAKLARNREYNQNPREKSRKKRQKNIIMTDIAMRIMQMRDFYAKGNNSKFAEMVGTSESSLRGYMKNVLPKIDILERIVRSCEGLSPRWLLTGEGEMTETHKNVGGLDEVVTRLLDVIRQKDKVILEQAEEIGRLREREDAIKGRASRVISAEAV